MTNRMDEYRCKLINKILFANSQTEVITFINVAVKDLEEQQVSRDFRSGFAEKMTDELGLFTPMNKDAQQWSNIQMARIHFNRLKEKVSVKVG